MALNLNVSRAEIIDRMKTDAQAELPESDPFLQVSFFTALIIAFGGRISEVYIQLQQLLLEMFPDTATGEFLARWGSYIGVTVNEATNSKGLVTFTGTAASSILENTLLQINNGAEYSVTASVVISENNNTITSLTYSSGTVYAETSGNHGYASNIDVVVSGADQADYNGTFTIFVTGEKTFTYEISGSPVTPATGSTAASADTATAELESQGFGAEFNLDSGAALTLITPISGVNSTAYVQFSKIDGGTNIENQEDYRTRVVDKSQNPNTPFNKPAIIDYARRVNGVTRVFVEEPDTTTGSYAVSSITRSGSIAIATLAAPHNLISGMYISINGADQTDYNVQSVAILVISPTALAFFVQNTPTTPATGTLTAAFAAVQPGQTKVIFTRDNDASIIPSAAEVEAVKDILLTIKPAHMAAIDLIVSAPQPVPVTFDFDFIVPNTSTMRKAIEANLDEFFRESTEAGTDLLQVAYDAAIFNTVDPDTGQLLRNFVLTSPAGDISVESGELPILEGVNF